MVQEVIDVDLAFSASYRFGFQVPDRARLREAPQCSSALMDVAQLARMVFHARYLGRSSSFAYYPESLRIFKHKHDLTRQATRFIRIEETTVNSIPDGSWDVTDSRSGHEQTSRMRAQHGLPERICFQKPQPIASHTLRASEGEATPRSATCPYPLRV